MIRYTLTCDNDHHFESWFQSGAAFDDLSDAGHISCAICGSTQVGKTMMAPTVKTAGLSEGPKAPLEKLKDHVQKNSDYVGGDFARLARSMHDGDTPERAIYGQANAKDARKLIKDGIPVLPLPFVPDKASN